MKKIIPIFAIPLLFASCESDPSCEKCSSTEPVKAEAATEASKTTADELLGALGGEVFTVEFPADLPETFYVGLALKYPDGTIKPTGRGNVNNTSKSARVFLFPSKIVSGYDYSILTENRQQHGSITLPSYRVSTPAPQGHTVAPGDGLIRFGSDSVAFGEALAEEGNFDIILQITPYEKN